MQEEFERAQQLAISTNQPISLVSKITVKPPEKENETFGQVSFSVNLQRPARKSIDFTTELQDGLIVSDGKGRDDLMQEELNLQFPHITTKTEDKKESNT